MKKSILTIALAVLALAGATSQASAQAPANVQAVDLGLPSGIRWASCNIGATAPEGYGNYYAWGETTTKTDYSWATYKHANGDYNKLTKYCSYNGNDGFTDNKTTLDPADDAAHVNWGGDWRMPTDAEWTELREQCTWTWTTQSGVNGYQVSSKTNSNSIFLPAAGCRDADLNNAGSIGYYWSASLNDYYPCNTWCINFGSAYHDRGYNSRYFGFSVRPVKEAVAGPTNVQATQGDTTGVTVTWDAVPDAVSYEITAESWDVAINKTMRTLTAGCRDADLNNAGSIGYYWSASLNDYYPCNTWCINFGSAYHDRGYNSRYFGFSVRPVKEAVAGPTNVQATQGDTTGVTVTWDAVPDAVSYEITAESWDVAINKTMRTLTANETHIKDTIPVRPALGRYTVKAVFADGSKSKASDAAVGYSVLETMQIRSISNRWPWNGKVDIDVEYKTVRTRFQQLFGLPNLPFPDNVTLTARTADGKSLPMRTLEKEPAVDKNYTVNRRTVQNGEQPEAISNKIFNGSGWLRIVWNADADTLGINAPGTTITLTASDDYARTTDSATVDVNTTKPEFITLTEKDTVVSLPWAARWADEASRSLNMQDGTDIQIRVISRGTVQTRPWCLMRNSCQTRGEYVGGKRMMPLVSSLWWCWTATVQPQKKRSIRANSSAM